MKLWMVPFLACVASAHSPFLDVAPRSGLYEDPPPKYEVAIDPETGDADLSFTGDCWLEQTSNWMWCNGEAPGSCEVGWAQPDGSLAQPLSFLCTEGYSVLWFKDPAGTHYNMTVTGMRHQVERPARPTIPAGAEIHPIQVDENGEPEYRLFGGCWFQCSHSTWVCINVRGGESCHVLFKRVGTGWGGYNFRCGGGQTVVVYYDSNQDQWYLALNR